MLTLKPSDLRPSSKTKLISTTHTKNKSIDHHTKYKSISGRTRSISTPAQKQVNFAPITKTKSISMPRHKTKLISIQTLKPSHFRPPHKNWVNSDPYTEINSGSIPRTEIK